MALLAQRMLSLFMMVHFTFFVHAVVHKIAYSSLYWECVLMIGSKQVCVSTICSSVAESLAIGLPDLAAVFLFFIFMNFVCLQFTVN